MANHSQLPMRFAHDDWAVFENFYQGPNQTAVGLLRNYLSGESEWPCLWLCGPEAVGKTHLLQAASSERHEQTGSAWYFCFDTAMPFNRSVAEGWAQSDLLCLDNIDCVIGDRAWEELLIDLYHQQLENQCQLLLSCRSLPKELNFATEDLRSRFSAAIVELKPLREIDMVPALQLRAGRRGLDLPDMTIKYLLRRYPRDMKSLHEVIECLDVAAMAAQRSLTVPFVKSVLES